LRTLGATRKQILVITGLEFFPWALAAATGIILAMGASLALAKLSLDRVSTPPGADTGILASIVTLTIVIGLINIRSVINKPPGNFTQRGISSYAFDYRCGYQH
jgi:putative ABC transport system permease protein